MIFFRANKFFVERRANVEEFLARDVMWPPVVLTELTATVGVFRSHFATLFDIRRGLFQVETPPTAGTRREVREIVNIEEVNYSCDKWQLYHRP